MRSTDMATTVTATFEGSARTFNLRESNGRLFVTLDGSRNHCGWVVLSSGAWQGNSVAGRAAYAAADTDWVSLYNAAQSAPAAAPRTLVTAHRSEFCSRCGSYCYGDCRSY